MSTALAIASVTAVLKDLLNNGIIDHDLTSTVGNVAVTALPPDRIDTSSTNPQSQLNLFLFQATPNQGWRNAALPSRDSNGERVSNPPLALDLSYMLTAYGAGELHAEILLGYGMQLLHETPVLGRDAIRRALAPPSPVTGGNLPPELQALFTSELAEQVEMIKLTPMAMNTEELSKLWGAFQAHYRPTTVYQASVVLIESRRPTRAPLSVRTRKLFVFSFSQPVVERVLSQEADGEPIVANQPILPGHNLVLEGRNLQGEDTVVEIGGIEVAPEPGNVSGGRVIAALPPAAGAGIQGAQVIHRRLLGSPPEPHRGVESNVVAFVLRPVIDDLTLSDVTDLGGGLHSAVLAVGMSPAVGPRQRAVLLLNEHDPPPPAVRTARAYSFPAPPAALASPPSLSPPEAVDSIAFPVERVFAGTYLVRLQVDGAQSVLATDAAGQFDSPRITIP